MGLVDLPEKIKRHNDEGYVGEGTDVLRERSLERDVGIHGEPDKS